MNSTLITPIKIAKKDRATEVYSKAIEDLWESEGARLINPLVNLLEQDSSEKVQVATAIALGKFAMLAEHKKLHSRHTPRIYQVLLTTTSDKDKPLEVRCRALEAVAPLNLPQVIKNIRLLGEMGFSFDLNLPPKWLHIGHRLLDECHGTPFILNHCGNADPVAFFPAEKKAPRTPGHDRDQWYRNMEALAQRPNMICKISGIVDNVPGYPLTASDLAPIIYHCIEVFGPDRVIFAGDWPVCLRNMPLAQWIGTLKEVVAEHSLADQRKLFHDNASAFYGLDG